MIGSTLIKCPAKAEVLVSRPARIWHLIKTGKPSIRHNEGWDSLTATSDYLGQLICQTDRLGGCEEYDRQWDAAKRRGKILADLGDDLYVRCIVPLPNILNNRKDLLECALIAKYCKMPSHTMPPIVVSAETIIDGKHRLEAAHRRGDKTVPVFKPTWLSVSKIRF